jgi:hypothetical protein
MELVVIMADGPAAGSGRHSLSLRVPPRYCDAQGIMQSGTTSFFEEAFLSWLEEACGGYLALQAIGATW